MNALATTPPHEPSPGREHRILLGVGMALFTLAVIISYLMQTHALEEQTRELAILAARANYEKDISLRQWATSHGGVYVPVDDNTPPNPYLRHVPERDLTTPSGRQLTLMNPAYMMRQIFQDQPGVQGAIGRITSLKPLNPINTPDPWERQALVTLDQGADEVLDFRPQDSPPQLRFMRPIITQEGCLKCHAQQGYKAGDQRGGIGVRLPLDPFLRREAAARRNAQQAHELFWAAGMLLLFGHGRLRQRLQAQRAESRAVYLQQERRYWTLVSQAPVGVFHAGPDGDLLDVNDAWRHMAGLELAQAMGWGWLEAVHVEDRPGVRAHWEHAVQHQQGFAAEFRFRHGDGPVFWALAQATPLLDETGGCQGFVGTLTDVTLNKEMEHGLRQAKEAAERANQTKSEFVAHVSHELRTPLNAMLGMGELLRETPLTPEQQRLLAISDHAGQGLTSLINDLLDLSKIESGVLDIACQPFDLAALLNETLEIFLFAAEEKGVRLALDGLPGLPRSVRGDAHRLRQVLINLLGNAIKFTESGSITLQVDMGEGDEVTFRVRDTGIGIPAAHIETIFLPFHQGDNRSGVHGGTGLGLTISARLVERMGGRLEVESAPGVGSCFHFTLPLHQVADAEGVHPGHEARNAPGAVRPLAILAVEDAADNRLLLHHYFKSTPHTLTYAHHGAEAVEAWCQGRFDLVLMDLQMPVMDGYQATRRIRALEAEQGLPPTPIVALTAHAFRDTMDKVHVAGFSAHLSKPFNRTELMAMVTRITTPPSPATA